MSVKDTLLSVQNVWFKYPGAKDYALEDISFDVNKASYIGIIGPNGGGKSTLISLLARLNTPTRGSVTKQKSTSLIGYVPQKITARTIGFPMTVKEIMYSSIRGNRGVISLFSQKDSNTIKQLAELTGVEHLIDKSIMELSGGEQQRVFIMRALLNNPEILILDEPTVGIDAKAQHSFYSLLKKLQLESNIAILFVTHDMDVIVKEADTVLCLNKRLVCHEGAHSFDKTAFIARVYGPDMKAVHHHHS